MTSKPVKWMIWLGFFIVALVGVGAILTSIVLPRYVEGRLLPRLSGEFGLSPGDLHVRRIGLWGSDLGPIRLNAPDGPVITVATVQVDYTPLSLIRGGIKGLTIGGLGIRASLTPDGLAITGLRMPSASDDNRSENATLDLRQILPIDLNQLNIFQSHLSLEWQGRRYVIPFDVELQTDQLRGGRLTGQVHLTLLGNPMTVTLSVDQPADLARLNMRANGFHMDGLERFLPPGVPVQLSGRLDIEAGLALGLNPFGFKGVAVSGRSEDIRLASPHGVLSPVTGDRQRPTPIEVSVSGESLSEIKWRCAPFQIAGPVVEATVNEISGIVTRTPDSWSLDGDIKTLIPEQEISGGIRLSSELSIDGQVAVRHDPVRDHTEFDLTVRSGGVLTAAMTGRQVTSQKQMLQILGKYHGGVLKAESTLTTGEVRIGSSEGEVRIPSVKAVGSMGLPLSNSEESIEIEALVEAPDIRARAGSSAMRLPKARIILSGDGNSLQSLQFDARIKVLNGRISDTAHALRLRKLFVDLPLKWPQGKGVKHGRLSIGSIEWQDQFLGSIKGTLHQKNHGLTMALIHNSKLFPGMRVLINGGVDRTGKAVLEASIPRHYLKEAIDLGRFQPAAAGVMASGHVEGAVRLDFENGQLDGGAQFQLSKGRLQDPGRNLLLEGVDMVIEIDDINPIQSAPQQKLQVDKLTFGNLKAENLMVDFQLENPGILFVEKAQIDWSEGKINTAAIRIVPGVDEYDIILFCDRLNLAMVLEQLGAAEADGDGTVNGRIPIHWDHGHLSFDNGFLFSSPGQTGAIQLKGTEVLLSGLPPGTPQHAQLDIATEALKDYTYKWAKMTVQTEDDVLLLKLQFDGKPNRLLPFAYDQQLGQFKRVAGQGQADFKGISIDLNLRSPLNEIMNYKELLK